MDGHSTIFDAPVATNFAAPITPKKVIEALATSPPTASMERGRLELLEQGYPWYSQQNRDEAQLYLQGIRVANHHQLDQQVWLYSQELFKLVTKDAAEQTLHVVKQYLSYQGQTYYYPNERSLPTTRFSVPMPSQFGSDHYEWVYYPIAEFAKLIPPHALQAMVLVEQNSVAAQAYWVADKLKVEMARRVSVDPLLYAQYGRWFVSVAHWL